MKFAIDRDMIEQAGVDEALGIYSFGTKLRTSEPFAELMVQICGEGVEPDVGDDGPCLLIDDNVEFGAITAFDFDPVHAFVEIKFNSQYAEDIDHVVINVADLTAEDRKLIERMSHAFVEKMDSGPGGAR